MKRKVVVPLIATNYVEVEIDDSFPSDVEEWNHDQLRYVSDVAFEKHHSNTGKSEYEVDENTDHWEIEQED